MRWPLTITILALTGIAAYSQSLVEASQREKARQKALGSHAPVLTNDDISQVSALHSAALVEVSKLPTATTTTQQLARGNQLREQILAQKSLVVSLQSRIEEIKKRLAPPEYVGSAHAGQTVQFAQPMLSSCDLVNTAALSETEKKRCEEPRRLQAELEDLEPKLAKEKSQLEVMQENARHAGFGTAIYDPD